jgi:D-inositol-3-phosphate glycosyltransferase
LYMNTKPKQGWLQKKIYGSLDSVVVSSQDLQRQVALYWPISPAKIHIIRYGILEYVSCAEENITQNTIDRLQNSGVETTTYYLPQKPRRLGVIARIDAQKNQQFVLDACLVWNKQNPNNLVTVLVVGEPTWVSPGVPEKQSAQYYKTVLDTIQSHPEYFSYLPFQDNLDSIWDSIDALVLSTIKETYSLTVLQAMAKQKFVFGSQTGGTVEQLQNSIGYLEARGLLFDPLQIDSFLQALDTWHNMTYIELEKYRARSLEFAKEHTQERCIQEWKKQITVQ